MVLLLWRFYKCSRLTWIHWEGLFIWPLVSLENSPRPIPRCWFPLRLYTALWWACVGVRDRTTEKNKLRNSLSKFTRPFSFPRYFVCFIPSSFHSFCPLSFVLSFVFYSLLTFFPIFRCSFFLPIHPSLSFPSSFPHPPTLFSLLVPSFLPSLPFSLVLVPSFASPFSLVLSRFLLIAFPSLFSSLFLSCSTHEKQNIFISQGLPSSATLHSQTRKLPSWMQAHFHLVKQRLHFTERHERGRGRSRWGLVTHKVGHGTSL